MATGRRAQTTQSLFLRGIDTASELAEGERAIDKTVASDQLLHDAMTDHLEHHVVLRGIMWHELA
jgi:hypothetical protein